MNWENNWVIDDTISPQIGGQGEVSKVRRKSDGIKGALKVLHAQYVNNSERRKRMVREVLALERLTGRGIPTVFEHNMDYSSEKSVPLFLVSKWIEGKNLQNVVNGHPQKLDYALKLTRDLAEIVKYCHGSGVLHRDIKPNNIILEAESNELYLVDFGLAYSDAEDNVLITAVRQELGNRFLRLPELGSGFEKKDPRADLTFVVGILFFLLSGRAPNNLIDSEGRPPHKRDEDIFPKHLIRDKRWRRVRSIFDVGFSINSNFRFQDFSIFIHKLDEVITFNTVKADITPTYLDELDQLEALRTSIDASIDAVENSLIKSLNNLATAIKALCQKHGIGVVHPSAKMIKPGREAKILWKVCHANSDEPYVYVNLLATLEGENRSNVSIRLATSKSERTLKEEKVFYRGPSADIDRLNEEIEAKAGDIFGLGISLLRIKIKLQNQPNEAT